MFILSSGRPILAMQKWDTVVMTQKSWTSNNNKQYIHIYICVVFTPCTQPSSQLLQAQLAGDKIRDRSERRHFMQHLLSDFVDA